MTAAWATLSVWHPVHAQDGDGAGPRWIIETVAGRSAALDDGRPAAKVHLRLSDVAVDTAGNVYIASWSFNRVRRMDAATGSISGFAGTGERGYGGDGGAATAALLAGPTGVAVDASGNVYIADRQNNRVRRVDGATGVISTVAGTGEFGFGGDGGSADDAMVGLPSGVAVDAAGNLYIADTANDRVRRVDGAGVITTVAGNGRAGFGGDGGPATESPVPSPRDVAVDASGNVYVADQWNGRVRRVDAATGVISTIAGTGARGFGGDGGPAAEAKLNEPSGVAADAAGNVYIADRENNRVRRIDAVGLISTFAGTGQPGFAGDGGAAADAQLEYPTRVAVDAFGNVFIVDSGNRRVRRVDVATAIISTSAGRGNGDGGPATDAFLASPEDVAVDVSGNMYIAGPDNRVRRVDAATGRISTFAGTGESDFFGNGGFGGDGGSATEALLDRPEGVAVDASGNVYIADSHNHRVRRVDATGVISTFAGSGEYGGFEGDGGPATEALLDFPSGVAVDASGNVYIADSYNHRVRRVDATGVISTFAGSGEPGFFGGFEGDGGSAVEARLNSPRAVAVDSSGDVYIADSDNHRIRRVDGTGVISTFAGTGEWWRSFAGDGGPAVDAGLFFPRGVAVDASGNVYIAENDHVRRVNAATGAISTFAGSGDPDGAGGHGGDGGPARDALLKEPSGVTVDPVGDLYIADKGNYLVRRVSPPGPGVVGDLDGDGTEDVLLRHEDGRWFYYPMNGRRHVVGGRGGAELPTDQVWSFVGMGDFDGEAGEEILLRHDDGRWRRYPMAGRRLGGEAKDVRFPRSGDWRIAAIADLNGDGNDDVLLRHVRGNWRYYPMQGGEPAQDGAGGARIHGSLGFRLQGVGDFNGDGKDDVLLRYRDGRWSYQPMDGRVNAGPRVRRLNVPSDLNWRLAGVGDFDGDGTGDVLLRHRFQGRWHYYRSADGNLSESGVAPLTRNMAYRVAAVGDLDGDGRDDVLLRRDDGRWYYYAMEGRRVKARGGVNLTRNTAWAIVRP